MPIQSQQENLYFVISFLLKRCHCFLRCCNNLADRHEIQSRAGADWNVILQVCTESYLLRSTGNTGCAEKFGTKNKLAMAVGNHPGIFLGTLITLSSVIKEICLTVT